MIIDDEAFNCQALVTMIELLQLPNAKNRVDAVLSGAEALMLVRKSLNLDEESHGRGLQFGPNRNQILDDEAPDCQYGLILSDCSMPIMDGYECAKEVDKLYEKAMVPDIERPDIIAITGHVEQAF